jgi:predicted small metal-binding protein
MASQVKCECGYIARADNDDEVIAKVRDHMNTDHPDVSEKVTDEDIRTWVEIVA